MSLENQTCVPCKGGIDPLTPDAAERYLSQVPGWSLSKDAKLIKRNIEFKNFAAALAFVNRVGELVEAENHHPDIHFGWGYCLIEFWTHKIGGLHENDFIVAAKVNRLLDQE